MKLILILFLMPFVSALFGCDPAYRVRRDSERLEFVVPFDCLISAIEKTPNVKIAQHEVLNSRYACEEKLVSRQVLYTVSGEPITITGCYHGDALKTFSQEQSGWVGNRASVNVPLILKTMREIESSIEKRCQARGLTSVVKNNCLRVDCID